MEPPTRRRDRYRRPIVAVAPRRSRPGSARARPRRLRHRRPPDRASIELTGGRLADTLAAGGRHGHAVRRRTSCATASSATATSSSTPGGCASCSARARAARSSAGSMWSPCPRRSTSTATWSTACSMPPPPRPRARGRPGRGSRHRRRPRAPARRHDPARALPVLLVNRAHPCDHADRRADPRGALGRRRPVTPPSRPPAVARPPAAGLRRKTPVLPVGHRAQARSGGRHAASLARERAMPSSRMLDNR